MSILHRHLLTAALGALSLAAGAACAQPGPGPGQGPGMSAGGPPPPKPKIACAADVKRFCPDQTTGRGAKRCLKGHMSEASPGCVQALQYAKEHKRARHAAAAQSGGPAPGNTPPPSGGNQPPR